MPDTISPEMLDAGRLELNRADTALKRAVEQTPGTEVDDVLTRIFTAMHAAAPKPAKASEPKAGKK